MSAFEIEQQSALQKITKCFASRTLSNAFFLFVLNPKFALPCKAPPIKTKTPKPIRFLSSKKHSRVFSWINKAIAPVPKQIGQIKCFLGDDLF